MLTNNIRQIVRGLRKDLGFSFINVIGLAIGLASCLLILLFVTDELSFDKHFSEAEDIYRIMIDAEIGGETQHFAVAPFSALPAFQNDIASIRQAVRVSDWDGQVLVGDTNFEEEGIVIADTSFFEIFNADFLTGNPEEVLDEPGAVVLTESIAKKIFGQTDVVGRPLRINDLDMAVTGVVKDARAPSHLDYDIVVSTMNLTPEQRQRRDEDLWYAIGMYSYVKLTSGTDLATFEEQLADVYEKRAGSLGREVGIFFTFHVQPLTDIHLHSQLQGEYGANGDVNYVYAFTIIAIFILLIACINFANLSTARSTLRAKEVGVRKAAGARQSDLVSRFLTESFVTVLLSMVFAILITMAAIGWLNAVTGKELTMLALATPQMILGGVFLIIVCGFVAGSYPAFVLSAFNPIAVLRGQVSGMASKSVMRRSLVVLQFSVSIVLIIGTFVVHRQLDFMKNKPLGFNKDAVAVLQMDTANEPTSWDAFKQTLLAQTSIKNASFASGVPGQTGELRLFVPEGNDSTQTIVSNVARVDPDYLETYGMELASGRFYSRDFPADTSEAFVINQAAAKVFGWTDESAIGKELEFRGVQESRVVGVVKDFHFRPLTEEIAPLVMPLARRPFELLTIRFERGQEVAGMEATRDAWASFESQRPLDITFIDEDLASRYAAQETASSLVTTFALLAIFIAALGLFGLASFAVQRRTKEIGVRKVLGASMSQLILIVNKEFLALLAVANLIAWPATYYLVTQFWLEQFPYRMSLTVLPFLVGAIVSLLVTLTATMYHASSAARAEAVVSLRYE